MDLQNYFLLAMPGLGDLNFNHSVVYVCAHNEEGSMGMVVNSPLADITLSEVLEQMNIDTDRDEVNSLPVYRGGPVQPERGFILHRPDKTWQSTLLSGDGVAVTSSQDILQSMAKGEGPKEVMIVLGYAGWGAGQLEQEVAQNLWLIVPAKPEILFDTPSQQRWNAAASLLGVSLAHLTDQTGHA